MFWNFVTKISKITGAVTAIMVGVWACAHESSRPLTTDAVTNARLIEIYAPAEGKLTQLAEEGAMFVSGSVLANITSVDDPTLASSDDATIVESFDTASALSDIQYTFGAPYETITSDTEIVTIADLNAATNTLKPSAIDVPPSYITETALRSETSGMIWNWRRTSGAIFRSGESAGYVAECSNLIAIGQLPAQQIGSVQSGDPIIFVTADAEWTGTVQQIVGGVPNLTGQYAIQFPVVAPESAMIFFALDAPADTESTCALGLSGQIRYPMDARRSPAEIGFQLLDNAKTNLRRAKNFYDASADYVRADVLPQ